MDDPNSNRSHQLIKDILMSPSSEETTCASTVGSASHAQHAPIANNDDDNDQEHDQEHEPEPEHEPEHDEPEQTRNELSLHDQRHAVRQQVRHLGLASTGALSMLAATLVPLPTLIGLAVVAILWGSFVLRLLQMGRLEYQNALQGRGLGEYLPASWYDQLVHMSFHEMMLEGTFIQEYQHFALYFIPGITAEQLNTYVERLIPRHRRALQRPGLGHFGGSAFMRHIVGEEGLTELAPPQQRQQPVLGNGPPSSSSSSSSSPPRRLELEAVNEDAASGLGDDDDDNDNDEVTDEHYDHARFWGTVPGEHEEGAAAAAAAAVSPRAGPMIESDPSLALTDDDEEEEGEEEEEDLLLDEEVVWDAAWAGAVYYRNWAIGLTRHAVAREVTRSAGTALRATVGAGVVTVGAGLFGMWAGFWSPQDFRLPRQLVLPTQLWRGQTNTILISSTMASGATAGLLMMLGFPLSNNAAAPSNPGRGPNSASINMKKNKKADP